jgi:Fur family ferric uptake transcriptional regulator
MEASELHSKPLIDRLRARAWRLTAQRRAVAQSLSEPNLHISADEVYRRARRILPEISRATVYNTLGELVEMGELDEVRFGAGPTLFDPNAPMDHHHLVCRRCGEIYDVQPEGLEHLKLRGRDGEGFSLEGVEVVFRGLCSSCR